MKQAKDPFEAALNEQDSPPESPLATEQEAADHDADARPPPAPSTMAAGKASGGGSGKSKEEEEEEEDENMDVELGKLPSGDPDKMVTMHSSISIWRD